MNIIFYVMDCLRADHVHALGGKRDSTPTLDRLAREGVAFSHCYSQSGWTAPSAATMFSGQHPSKTGIHKMRDGLNPALPWLPEMLAQNSFRTVGFSSMYQVSKLRGFDRGFESMFDLFMDAEIMETCRARGQASRGDHYCLPLSEDLHKRALAWLDEHQKSERAYDPFYWMIWSTDTHEPFRHPPEFNKDADAGYRGPVTGGGRPFAQVRNSRDKQHLIDLYDGALRYQDAKLGELVTELEKRGILDDTLLIVVGDHGEMFWEHGLAGHGKFPWEEELRVPCIMRFPQALPQGKVYDTLMQMIDLPPTIADLAGLPTESRFAGKSLRPIFEGSATEVHDHIVLEVPFPFDRAERARVVITRDRWKYVEYSPPAFSRRLKKVIKEHGRALTVIARPGTLGMLYGHHFRKGALGLFKAAYVEPWFFLFGATTKRLFDLKTDPGENRDLAGTQSSRVSELAARLTAIDATTGGGGKATAVMSAAEQEKKIEEHLRELGYVED